MDTILTFKVVSTKKHLRVNDLLGVDVRKDVKKVSKLLGKANGKGTAVTNTYSTELCRVQALNAETESVIHDSALDTSAGMIRFLDAKDDPILRKKVNNFHKVVHSEKQKLKDEYGSTSVPADRYREYLNACREVEVTYWATQLVVTKVSSTPFEGGTLNTTSGKYHCTVKTKTVYTENPITSEYLVAEGLVEEYSSDSSSSAKTYRWLKPVNWSANSSFRHFENGRVRVTEVRDNRTGELVLTLKKVES